MNDWTINTDMYDEDTGKPTQWVYKDKVMVDLVSDKKYLVNVYSEKDGEFYYFDWTWSTLEDAKEFVENAWDL